MKRFLFCLLAISLCSAAALADDDVRAAQSRLKDGGFYFGKIDGVYNGETAAAVSRFQIRSGLQISGQLDAETYKALGVNAAATEAPPPPNAAGSDTWRRLRKADPQFLAKLKTKEKHTAVPAEGSQAAPPAGQAEGGSAFQTFTLSQERLRDYVGAFVLAGLDPHVGAELEFFADRVDYYDDGVIGRDKIRADLQRYSQRWPQRRFWLAGPVNVEPQPDSRLRVTFPLRFELRNGSKRASGKVLKTLLVEVTADDLQIVGVNERKPR
jgi:peptidoglycan hydrolase-like protein with peptidoglycan-binding domain